MAVHSHSSCESLIRWDNVCGNISQCDPTQHANLQYRSEERYNKCAFCIHRHARLGPCATAFASAYACVCLHPQTCSPLLPHLLAVGQTHSLERVNAFVTHICHILHLSGTVLWYTCYVKSSDANHLRIWLCVDTEILLESGSAAQAGRLLARRSYLHMAA